MRFVDVRGRSTLMAIRVLIVEDEPLLAFDIAHHLEEAGFDVLGPAASVARALGIIENGGCDIAVLDVNLGRETAEPVATELTRIGTPFVVLSGYSASQHPPAFQCAPSLTKPARPSELIGLLRRLTSQKDSSDSRCN
jgi:DNA-binding response OmpR family regulator